MQRHSDPNEHILPEDDFHMYFWTHPHVDYASQLDVSLLLLCPLLYSCTDTFELLHWLRCDFHLCIGRRLSVAILRPTTGQHILCAHNV